MTMRNRLVAVVSMGLLLAVGYASAALAHGEKAQESFLRMQTVAFFDTKYSTDTVEQGGAWSVSGTMKILETWPETLGEPKVAYIGVTTQGPISIMTERIVNGKDTPHSIYVKRGDVFNYKMSLQGRRVGRWHVHPIIGVEGAGSVMGPGQWLTVNEAEGGFSFPLTLMNGETVDVETYGFSLVMTLNVIGFVIGVWFLWHWTGARPTVTRLRVNLQIGLHDTGEDFGLIEKRDYTWMNVFAVLTLILLAVGWFYATTTYPNDIPLQVIRFEPPKAPQDPSFTEHKAGDKAIYDVAKKSLIIPIEITNTGNSDARVVSFVTSTLVFTTAAGDLKLELDSDEAIAPNSSMMLTLTMTDQVWEEERMIPIGEAQMLITGVVIVENSAGQRNLITVQMPLQPTSFKGYRGAIYY